MTEKLYNKLSEEERHKRNLERLAKMRPMDDTLMRELFRDNIPLAQKVLRIIIGKDDLIVTKEQTQYDMKQILGGRSACLDVLAEDSEGNKYNIEVQRSDEGADPDRAVHHSNLMGVEFSKQGKTFGEKPMTYVIFITENDVRKGKRPIYKFSWMDEDSYERLGDGAHIIYVNGAYDDPNDDSELAKLIHDFRCSKAEDMFVEELAEKMHYCKDDVKGAKRMCRIMEEYAKEERAEERFETRCSTAIEFLKMGYSVEVVAKGTHLPLETVKDLAERFMNDSEK